jgi:hypothetical protein
MACHASAVSSPRTLGPALSIVLRAAGFNSRAGLVRLMSRRLEASVWQLARCGTTSRSVARVAVVQSRVVQWNPYIRYCIRKHGTPRGDPTQISAITLTAAFENGDMNMINLYYKKVVNQSNRSILWSYLPAIREKSIPNERTKELISSTDFALCAERL